MKNENRDGKTDSLLMRRLVEFILNTSYDRLPSDLVRLAKEALLDTVGVSLAGWQEPAVQIAKEAFVLGSRDGSGRSSLWGEPVKAEADKAAVVNGTASHVLDYDDASVGTVIHPSAPVYSAVLPLAEKLDSSGKDIITAYAIGTEVMVRIGQVMGIRHYNLGWHSTDTLGTIGAAAACAYLLRLGPEQIAHAVAIAASIAGGLQKNFGSMTKPLHVGFAASHAIQAVNLAKLGFTGNHEIFEQRGFFHAFSGGLSEEGLKEIMAQTRFGEPYDLLDSGLSVKKFPCCFGTHRFIQAVLELKSEHGLRLDDLDEIVLKAQRRTWLPLVHHRPIAGLQGKFSAEYTVLAAIEDGYVRFSSFEDEAVQRPRIQQLFPIIQAVEKESTDPSEFLPIDVLIKTADGRTLEKSLHYAPGSKQYPMSEIEHREKWMGCVAHYVKQSSTRNVDPELEKAANKLYDQGLSIETFASFSDWTAELHHKLG